MSSDFPQPGKVEWSVETGMTLRDYVAAHILHGWAVRRSEAAIILSNDPGAKRISRLSVKVLSPGPTHSSKRETKSRQRDGLTWQGDHTMFKPKQYKVRVESVCPILLNQLKPSMLDPSNKPPRGKADEWERDHWRDKMEVVDGRVAIPGEYFEQMAAIAASRMGERVPGKGMQTYTKYFQSAFFVAELLVPTDVLADKVEPFIKPVSAQGKKGSGKVLRYRPILPEWRAEFTATIHSDLISADVLLRVLEFGGAFVGIGDWRPKFGRVSFEIAAA